MTRLTILALIAYAALALTGCGGGKTETAKTTAGAGDTHEHTEGDGHDHSEGDGHEHTEGDGHDHSEDNATGGQGHTHQEGTVASEEETVAITGDKPNYTAMTHDGWMVQVTPAPAVPAVGTITWEVLVHAPNHTPVTAGQLLIEPEGQEIGTGKKLALSVTQGEPGNATIAIPVETPGTYEVEFHLHRSDGGDSHTKYTFTVA